MQDTAKQFLQAGMQYPLMKIADRFFRRNRNSVENRKSISDFSGGNFNRDCCCDLKMKTRSCFEKDDRD